jgi:hypothetical protein
MALRPPNTLDLASHIRADTILQLGLVRAPPLFLHLCLRNTSTRINIHTSRRHRHTNTSIRRRYLPATSNRPRDLLIMEFRGTIVAVI